MKIITPKTHTIVSIMTFTFCFFSSMRAAEESGESRVARLINTPPDRSLAHTLAQVELRDGGPSDESDDEGEKVAPRPLKRNRTQSESDSPAKDEESTVTRYLKQNVSSQLAKQVSALPEDEEKEYLKRLFEKKYLDKHLKEMPLLLNYLLEKGVSLEAHKKDVEKTLDKCGPVGAWEDRPISYYWPKRDIDMARQILQSGGGEAYLDQLIKELKKGEKKLTDSDKEELREALSKMTDLEKRLPELSQQEKPRDYIRLSLYKRMTDLLLTENQKQEGIQRAYAQSLVDAERERKEAEAKAEQEKRRAQELAEDDNEGYEQTWGNQESDEEMPDLEDEIRAMDDVD